MKGFQFMSKKNYRYVPCVKRGDNGGWMGDKFFNMKEAWEYLITHAGSSITNDTVFIGVIKCKKDENPFTRIADIGLRSYNGWD